MLNIIMLYLEVIILMFLVKDCYPGTKFAKLTTTDCDVSYRCYENFKEAKKACYQDSNCVAIHDSWCDNKKFKLCSKESDITYSTIGSCAYVKDPKIIDANNNSCIEHGYHKHVEGVAQSTVVVRSFEDIRSPELCQSLCNANKRCKWFNWGDDRLPNGCWLIAQKATKNMSDFGRDRGATGPKNCIDSYPTDDITRSSLSIVVALIVSFLACLLICFLTIMVRMLKHKSMRAYLYSHPIYSNIFPNEADGPVFIVHVDEDLDTFMLLKDTLEGSNKNINKKRLGGRIYTTLYHERDFVPGNLIIENIERCVENCYRTLIIMTPALLKSDWCRDEFSIANRNDKAIFIKLEADDCTEKELQALLSLPENSQINEHLKTRTYLKWTGQEDDDEFWVWLTYLLPHKRFRSSDGCWNLLRNYVVQRDSFDSEMIEISTASEQPNENYIELDMMTEDESNLAESIDSDYSNSFCSSKKESSIIPHINEVWFHPSFASLTEAAIALIKMSNVYGSFIVTDIPDAEKSYGLYRDGDYILLLRGTKQWDVFQSAIHRQFSTGGYMLFGVNSDRVFESLYDLINYYRLHPASDLQANLTEPLQSCNKCRKCRSAIVKVDQI